MWSVSNKKYERAYKLRKKFNDMENFIIMFADGSNKEDMRFLGVTDSFASLTESYKTFANEYKNFHACLCKLNGESRIYIPGEESGDWISKDLPENYKSRALQNVSRSVKEYISTHKWC